MEIRTARAPVGLIASLGFDALIVHREDRSRLSVVILTGLSVSTHRVSLPCNEFQGFQHNDSRRHAYLSSYFGSVAPS